MNKIAVHFKHNQLENIYKVSDYIVADNTLLMQFIIDNSLNKASISINVNELYYSEDEASEYVLKHDDVVKIEVLAQEPISAIITAIGVYLKAHAIIAFFVKVAATLIISALIAQITKPKNRGIGNNLQNDKQERNTQNYGIAGARNDTRLYSPLKLGIGSIRILADYNTTAFTNYKVDTQTPIFISNRTAWVEAGLNYTGGGMAAYGLVPLHTQTSFLGGSTNNYWTATFYGASRAYKAPASDTLYTAPYTYVVYTLTTYDSSVGISTTTDPLLTTFEDFADTVQNFLPSPLVINGVAVPEWMNSYPFNDKTPSIDMSSSNPIPYPSGTGTLNVIKYFGYFKFETQKRLVQLLNAGFGDCTIDSYLASKIDISNFKGVKITRAIFNNKNTYFGGNLPFGNQTYERPDYINASATLQYQLALSTNLIINTLSSTGRLVANNLTSNGTIRFERRSIHGGGEHDYNFIITSNQGIATTTSTANKYFKHWDAVTGNSYEGAYPVKVEVLTGGDLRRTRDDLQQETGYQESWIIRSGGAKPYAIEINFTGTLFKLDSFSKIIEHKISLDIRYRQKQTGVQTLPNSSWVTLDSAYVLKNDDSLSFGKTAFFEIPINFDKIEIAVRKNETDAADSNITENMAIESINVFCQQTHLYPAQNRVAIELMADNQLNGSVADHISSIANYSTWVWAAGLGNSDSGLPNVNGGGWTWQHTRNPAYWYLYFVLGGYLNEDTPSNHPLYTKGWYLGQHAQNKRRIFGCGEEIANIDFNRIVEWANYCDSHNLKIDMELSGDDNTYNTLLQIASVGRARPTRRLNGKLSVIFHDINAPIKAEFGRANILNNTLKTIYNNKRNADEYIANYVDRSDDFIAKTVRFTVPLVQNPTNVVNVDIVGITSKDQAERECRLACANEFYNKEVKEFETGLQYFSVECGDVIRLADMTDSGRLVSLTIAGGLVVEITLSCELAFSIGTPYFISVTSARGDLAQHSCIIIASNKLQILTQWLAANAPEIIDDAGTTNSASAYIDCQPIDFTFLGSTDTAIAGKYRILQIAPNEKGAKITVAREIAEFYACEYSLANVTGMPSQLQNNVATIENMCIAQDENGYRLYWDNIDCKGADLSISVNGGAAGVLAVDSDYINISYAVGTSLSISAMPRNISVVTLQQSKVFDFVV
jgi:hypothetical protein